MYTTSAKFHRALHTIKLLTATLLTGIMFGSLLTVAEIERLDKPITTDYNTPRRQKPTRAYTPQDQKDLDDLFKRLREKK